MTSRKGSKYVSGSTDAQSACVTQYFGDTVFPHWRWHVNWCVKDVMWQSVAFSCDCLP